MNAAPCHAYPRLIAFYSLGHVTAEEETSLQRHLAECRPCQAYLEELRALHRQFDLAAETQRIPGGSATAGLFDTIASAPRKCERPPIFWPVAIAAGIALLAAAGFLSFRFRSPDAPAAPTVEALRPIERSPLSLGTYRAAAEESLEDLDTLLNDQALQSSGLRMTMGMRNSEL